MAQESRYIFRFDRYDRRIGLVLTEKRAYSLERTAAAHTRYKTVDITGHLPPQFMRCLFIVTPRVVGIFKLLRDKYTRILPAYLLETLHRSLDTLIRWGQHEFGPQ